ncbi:hypothetical protein LEL_09912 [Akanthomyces lecanii RCEF 1005]|uniref:Uncharacterized protein n=1 Tax=Akanthomyces lecanii RCEF 1005 TaxID=1081108 RepID=A0A168BGT5_CORDF|nr:hypothetical protein LEL_09912 [Akanthomyces lecanii RCEF 1005]
MGLPLFIAPVESDVARKSTNKNATTSPSRTSIRRVDRASERERQRNSVRRAAARIYGPVQRTLSNRSQERPLPWIESSVAPENAVAGVDRLRSMQESLREMSREDARRSQRMEEHMATVFGTSWHDLPPGPPSEETNQETDLGWWSIDPRGRARRPRMMTPISSRFTRSPDTLDAVRAQTSSPFAAENSTQADQNARQQRIRLAQLTRNAHARHRSQTTRRSTGVDGLGDRERSMSPEGWDTLLTTLAPDPQPPSANTSFASATGTQSAGQSAGQSSAAQPSAVQPPTGSSILPDGFDDAPVDPGCDSGCEHSDSDDGAAEARAEARRFIAYRNRRNHLSRYNEQARAALQSRPRPSVPEHPDAPSIAERQALSRVPIPESNTVNPWVTQASIGADEPENAHAPRHARIMTFSSGEAPAEEDLSGMQHIVRSMAQREDIPEEWWLEAGLSRTLSQQGTN